jgi:hypothetical protein
MSNDNSNNIPSADMPRQRRASISTNPIASMFQRSGSIAAGTQVFPGPITTAAMNDQRRRLSISTSGLTGTSPSLVQTPFGLRRGSISTNASIEEQAIDDEDMPANHTAPNTPFTRRMSFGTQAMRGLRVPSGTSPGGNNGRPSPPLRRSSTARGPPTPPTSTSSSLGYSWNAKRNSQASIATSPRAASDLISVSARPDQGFNWSEQLRSRAESIAAGASRPVGLSASPPRGNSVSTAAPPQPQQSASPRHDRAKSVSDMAAPPVQAVKPRPQKPDHFQERILKGDFYMD